MNRKQSFRKIDSSLLGRVAFAFTVTCCLRNGHYYSVPRRVCQEVFRIIFIIMEKSLRYEGGARYDGKL